VLVRARDTYTSSGFKSSSSMAGAALPRTNEKSLLVCPRRFCIPYEFAFAPPPPSWVLFLQCLVRISDGNCQRRRER
jgi:hypothetical protein